MRALWVIPIFLLLLSVPALADHGCYQSIDETGITASAISKIYTYNISDHQDYYLYEATIPEDHITTLHTGTTDVTLVIGGTVHGNGTLTQSVSGGYYIYSLAIDDLTTDPADESGDTCTITVTKVSGADFSTANKRVTTNTGYSYWMAQTASSSIVSVTSSCIYWTPPTPTPTPTPDPSNATISVNLLEKYSNAALVGQSVTLTPTIGGSGETKTSTYGETLHFGVVNGYTYWINASRSGYEDYNETYTIASSSGVYTVYMERILTPIANHSYAHFSVVDQTNGGLIPNAEIRLSDGQTKLTNSAGYAWFSVNNSEQINYYVSKPSGYWPAYGAMNLTADESILVALQRYSGPTATSTLPGWTPVTVPTTGTGVNPVVTLSAQLRQQNVQEGMDVWYTNLPFISQFLFLLFIIGGLGLMAGGTRRN